MEPSDIMEEFGGASTIARDNGYPGKMQSTIAAKVRRTTAVSTI